MGVDQAGHHQAAPGLEHFRSGAVFPFDIPGRADSDDFRSLNRHGAVVEHAGMILSQNDFSFDN